MVSAVVWPLDAYPGVLTAVIVASLAARAVDDACVHLTEAVVDSDWLRTQEITVAAPELVAPVAVITEKDIQ